MKRLLNKINYPNPIILAVTRMLAFLLLVVATSCSQSLHPGHYTYNQIKRAGYDCKPFKGRHYIRATKDSSKADIWLVRGK